MEEGTSSSHHPVVMATLPPKEAPEEKLATAESSPWLDTQCSGSKTEGTRWKDIWSVTYNGCYGSGYHDIVPSGHEMQAVHYEPPKPKPMVRPAYLYFIPSPAALSFNFAVQSYQPAKGMPRPLIIVVVIDSSHSISGSYNASPLTATYWTHLCIVPSVLNFKSFKLSISKLDFK